MAIFNGWQITRTGVVFVVGVIVLVGLVFGGILLVKDRGEQARRQEAVKIAEQNLESQSKTDTNTETKPQTSSEATTSPGISNAQSQTTSTTQTSTDLPATGADISQILIITLLTLAASYYVTSRRAVRGL